MIDYNDGKWHVWNGGECPVHPESVVEVSITGDLGTGIANLWSWPHDGTSTDIVAFRVVKPYREPREWWVDPDRCIATAYYHAGFVKVREVME